MDIALLVILLITNAFTLWRVKRIALPKTTAQAELTAVKEHRLVKTWIEPYPEDGCWPGWRWLCACGTGGASNLANNTSYGNEASAVKKYKIHAELYASVDEDDWKIRYEAKVAEFAAYRKLCYCKETNDDLIDYRGK